MKGSILKTGLSLFIGSCLMLAPVIIQADSLQTPQGPPPVAQPLIREGTLETKLVAVLNLGTATTEAQAESMLGEKGISPINGWIADYPVTPDILAELYQAVGDAADANKIPLPKTEALKRLDSITGDLAITINPNTSEDTAAPAPEGVDILPTGDDNDYYSSEGPPVVTYYPPPDDYYYLYSYVPYPFWYNGFGFGGFFILNDFHRPVFDRRHHHRGFVSNHVVSRGNQVVRVDPIARSNGRAAAGIGVDVKRGWGVGNVGVIRNTKQGQAPPAIKSMPKNTQVLSITNSGRVGLPMAHQADGNTSSSYKSSVRSDGNYSHAVNSTAPRSYSTPAGNGSYSAFSSSSHAGAMAAPSYHSNGRFSGGGFSGGRGRR